MNFHYLVKKRIRLEENHQRAHAQIEKSKTQKIADVDAELTKTARMIRISCTHCTEASEALGWKFIYDTVHVPSVEYTDHWSEESWNQKSDLLSYLVCPNCKRLNMIAEHEQREIIIELLRLEKRSKIGKFGRSDGHGSNYRIYLEDPSMGIIERVGEIRHGKPFLYWD